MKKAFEEILNRKGHKISYPLSLYKKWFDLNNWLWTPEFAHKKAGMIRQWTFKYIDARMDQSMIKKPNKALIVDDVNKLRDKYLIAMFSGLLTLALASSNWKKYTSTIERSFKRHEAH